MQINNILNRLRINKSSAIITLIALVVFIISIITIVFQVGFKPKDTSMVFLSNLKKLNFDKLKISTDDIGKNYLSDFEKNNNELLSILIDSLNFKFDKNAQNDNLQIQYYDITKFNNLIKDTVSNPQNYTNGNINKRAIIDEIKTQLKDDIKSVDTNLIVDNGLILGKSSFYEKLNEIVDASLLDTKELFSTTLASNSEASSEPILSNKETLNKTSENSSVQYDKNNSSEVAINNKDIKRDSTNSKNGIDNSPIIDSNNENPVNTVSNDINKVNETYSINYENKYNNSSNNIDSELAEVNNSLNNDISTIIVGSYYTISQGDDLIEIAKKAYSNYENPELYVYKIIEANQLNDLDGIFYLYVGQVIYIPEP